MSYNSVEFLFYHDNDNTIRIFNEQGKQFLKVYDKEQEVI